MMSAKRVVQAGLFVILAVMPTSSQATSELHKNVTVGVVGEWVVKLNAHSNFSFDIMDDGSDDAYNVIVDVFSYPDRALLGEGWPSYGEVFHPAGVYVPSMDHDRAAYVVVRPIGDALANITLRVTRTAQTPEMSLIVKRDYQASAQVPLSWRHSIPSGLVANTHVWTTEENAMTPSGAPGTNDTVLLVLRDGAAIAFDDDSGLTRMSWLHLFQDCPGSSSGHTCEIIVAQRSNDKSGRAFGDPGYDRPPLGPSQHATIAWDEDIHNGAWCESLTKCWFDTDHDHDGLGDALEDYIHTDKYRADTDGDGLPDGVEVIGVSDNKQNEETRVNLLRFPFYGADPLKPDLFIEADWTPGCVGGPAQGCPDLTKHKNRLVAASRIAALFSPDINVHVDNGIASPGNGTVYGDWGGAEVLGDADIAIGNQYCCKGWSPARKGYFAHVLSKDSLDSYGRCTAVANLNPSGSTHELGHYAGLEHWGDREGRAGKLNCKPHYFSVMNYNYEFLGNIDPATGFSWFGPGAPFSAFSRGLYKNLGLNPSLLYETAGLRDSPPSFNALAFLNSVLHLHVEYEGGGVDWNGNGEIESGQVQGMLNTPAYAGADCDPSPPVVRANFDKVALAAPSLNVEVALDMNGNVEGDALYINGIVPGVQTELVVGKRVNLDDCALEGTGSCARWASTGAGSGARIHVNPQPAPFSPAVAGGIVVYADSGGKLYYFRKPPPSGSSERTISVTPVGGPPISSHPIAIERPSGLVSVYAPSQGYLRRWDYLPPWGWVRKGITENWAPVGGADPQPIQTTAGIGLTWGYQRGLNGESQPSDRNLYAAILTSIGSGPLSVVLARLDAEELDVTVADGRLILLKSQWNPMPAAQIPIVTPEILWAHPNARVVPTRIGLAFRPDHPEASVPGGEPGRFYVTWQLDVSNVGGTCYENQPFFALSRGNHYSDTQDMSTVARTLVFDRVGRLDNAWSSWASGASLVYFQGNVRGAYQTAPLFSRPCASPPVAYDPMSNPRSSFFPNIDGIFNFFEYDHDDVSYMKSHLSWALRQ
jgi:hypothetical protein